MKISKQQALMSHLSDTQELVDLLTQIPKRKLPAAQRVITNRINFIKKVLLSQQEEFTNQELNEMYCNIDPKSLNLKS